MQADISSFTYHKDQLSDLFLQGSALLHVGGAIARFVDPLSGETVSSTNLGQALKSRVCNNIVAIFN